MSDPELEAIRQQRLAQLQSQYKVNYIILFLTSVTINYSTKI